MVGRPGHFVAVQVKCTIAELRNGSGYVCSTCSSHKPYEEGSFDFLAAYVVLEDAWYIIPGEKVWGMLSVSLATNCAESRYEEYREAWRLLGPGTGIDLMACGEEVEEWGALSERDLTEKVESVPAAH